VPPVALAPPPPVAFVPPLAPPPPVAFVPPVAIVPPVAFVPPLAPPPPVAFVPPLAPPPVAFVPPLAPPPPVAFVPPLAPPPPVAFAPPLAPPPPVALVPVLAVLGLREGREDAAHDHQVVVIEDALAHQVRRADRVLVQELLVRRLVHDAQDAAAVLGQKRDAQVAVLQHHGVVRRAGCLRARGRGPVPDAAGAGLDREVRELERGGRARDGVGARCATGSGGAGPGGSPAAGSGAAGGASACAASAASRGTTTCGSSKAGRVAGAGATSGAATGSALLGPARPSRARATAAARARARLTADAGAGATAPAAATGGPRGTVPAAALSATDAGERHGGEAKEAGHNRELGSALFHAPLMPGRRNTDHRR